MLPTLLSTSLVLLLGGSFHDGPGPASTNTEWFTAPRVGLSSREDVTRMWGKPASEKIENGYSVCTWRHGRKTVTLKFSVKLDVLVERKVAKH